LAAHAVVDLHRLRDAALAVRAGNASEKSFSRFLMELDN